MSADLKSELVSRALALGFDLCRVAPASAPPHAEAFDRWLAGGNAGEMAWLERNRERRTDPQQVLPGAHSIIVLAMNYWQGAPEAAPGSGKIARYAWGADYHDLIEKRLWLLDDWLATQGGRQRHYVDTGPVLERDFAALAGAGWHGKSTMLISRELGTWFFLAEILTTLEMPPDTPARDHCGTCTRCIAACPTGAIDAPHHLDARRCISYLTIELKGSIPIELRPLIGDRIYGCDDCLAACPWNRFARASQESAFAARDSTRMPLRDFLSLTEEDFRALFRKSPIKRIKRRGLLRNVCVALGNIGTRDDLPALERAVADPEPLVREHAQWAIGQIAQRLEKNCVASPRR
ncbi:MAG TPA: tRNA epoxyqueuosine(34) reductase QueG [Chthoniobacteraceae bacterium]|jgi:epoxyqueuosine reductase|nr:tRNA epoxyqueuosine(34) reductase QueG [Chthoniobacteraceae bacterium]